MSSVLLIFCAINRFCSFSVWRANVFSGHMIRGDVMDTEINNPVNVVNIESGGNSPQTEEGHSTKAARHKRRGLIDLIDWWGGTVILTFFPVVLAVLISLLIHISNFYVSVRDIQEGETFFALLLKNLREFLSSIDEEELILCCFLISISSVINYDKAVRTAEHTDEETDRNRRKLYFYSLFIALTELVLYVIFKLLEFPDWLVLIASILLIYETVKMARQNELFPEE